MSIVNIHEAKTHLSRILERVVIARNEGLTCVTSDRAFASYEVATLW